MSRKNCTGATVATKKRQVLSEHEGLARELVNLESALADVIAFRKRQAQTYSLVPYLGKSGENRRPIYIECQASQVIVHPERMIASTVSWDGSSQLQAARTKAGRAIEGQFRRNETETICALSRAARRNRHLLPRAGRSRRPQHRFRL